MHQYFHNIYFSKCLYYTSHIVLYYMTHTDQSCISVKLAYYSHTCYKGAYYASIILNKKSITCAQNYASIIYQPLVTVPPSGNTSLDKIPLAVGLMINNFETNG